MTIATTIILVVFILPNVLMASSETDVADITTRLKSVEKKLDGISNLLIQGNTIMDWRKCRKGMASENPIAPRVFVKVPGNKLALCDTETDGGGWLVFQRRTTFDQEFYLGWKDYKKGFGDVQTWGDFWLGLDSIHNFMSLGTFELRAELGTKYAHFPKFTLGDEASNYTLGLEYGVDSRNLGYGWFFYQEMEFATFDHQNNPDMNCAEYWHGAWWYGNCGDCGFNCKGMRHKTEMKMRLVQ